MNVLPKLTLQIGSLLVLALALQVSAAQPLRPDSTRREFDVDGIKREALIYAPASAGTNKPPVVFIFHGHGGTAQRTARSFAIERHWPEAICVYMQGLNTPGRLTDPEGKRSGWQQRKGHMQDRDLKFFDVVLSTLRKDFKVDSDRVYSTGHSNGGAFTYLLWAERESVFAAVAPSAAAANAVEIPKLKPKPAMHIAGQADALVKFEWQRLTMEAIRKVNGCKPTGEPWAPSCTLYTSANGTPVVTYVHRGAHGFQPDAPPLIVRFFKEHARSEKPHGH